MILVLVVLAAATAAGWCFGFDLRRRLWLHLRRCWRRRGGSIVGSLLGNNGTGIPPKVPVIIELDADASGVTADDVKIDCS